MDPDLGNRRRQRYPVKDMTISISGKSYRIFNISELGVGFLIDSPDEIEIGTEIRSSIVNKTKTVPVTGIPRHVSQFQQAKSPLQFQTGWVCGTEFTTQLDVDGGQMLKDFIAENIAGGDDTNER